MAWDYKKQWEGEMGGGMPSLEVLEGQRLRLKAEEDRRKEEQRKSDLRRSRDAAERAKKQKEAEDKQARKAKNIAQTLQKREQQAQKQQDKPARSGMAQPSAPRYSAPTPSIRPAHTSSESVGDGIVDNIKFFFFLGVFIAVCAALKWGHAKVAASLLALFGLTSGMTAFIVLMLGCAFPIIAVFVAYRRERDWKPIWTTPFVWGLVAPTAVFTGFMLLSFIFA